MSFKVIQINFDYLLTGIVFVTEAIDNSTMRNKLFFVEAPYIQQNNKQFFFSFNKI